MEQTIINLPKADITQPQNFSNNRQITPAENNIGRELLHINQLIAYPKDGHELTDWAISLNKLMPGLNTAHLGFVIDLMKLNVICFDKNDGIRNIFRGLQQTRDFFEAVTLENNFRKRRAAFVQQSKLACGMAKTLTHYVNEEYFRILRNARVLYFFKEGVFRQMRKESSKRTKGPDNKLKQKNTSYPEINLQRRLQLYRHIYFTYRHPRFRLKEPDAYSFTGYVGLAYPKISSVDFSLPNEINPIEAYLKKATAMDLFKMGYQEKNK